MTISELWKPAFYGAVICGASLHAGAASAPLDGLLACRDLTDATSRLACFDRESARLGAGPSSRDASAPSVGAAPAVATPPSAPPTLNAQQQFGLSEGALAAHEVAAGARPVPAAKLNARLTQLGAASDGRLVFTLDNDQVWKQIATEGELLAKQGEAVTISRGWLNSYYLQLENGRGCKVQRVK
jgi:hypothetical protein